MTAEAKNGNMASFELLKTLHTREDSLGKLIREIVPTLDAKLKNLTN